RASRSPARWSSSAATDATSTRGSCSPPPSLRTRSPSSFDAASTRSRVMETRSMKPDEGRGRPAAALVLLVLFLAAPVLAAPVRPIRFDHLSLEEGLSQVSVQDILQDSRGYIWLATEEGLNRYDGLSFKVYKRDPGDAASLPSSFVWDVEEDASGNLWVATAAGLAGWERTTDRFSRQEALAGQHIRMLRFAPRQSALWIGTRDSGLVRLDIATGARTAFAHDAQEPGSLVDDRVYALHVDAKD